MKAPRSSLVLIIVLAVTIGLLTVAAASAAPPEKRCYDENHEEIPCPESNYLQTQKAERDASRDSGPSYTPALPFWTLTPTASPSATPTVTAAATQAVAPGVTPGQGAQPVGGTSPQTAPQPSTLQMMVPFLLLGCGGLIVLLMLAAVVRWFVGRSKTRPAA